MIVDMERERYRASTHYVWRLEPADILGEGAFGTVYRGFHKETCETVAIKTFNKMALKRPYSVQMRELNILEKLDHPNVVRLIAVEDEITSVLKHGLPRSSNAGQQVSGNSLEGKVLIMEMCTEGNLYSIVEQPENQFGLDETELLRVLSHTTSGMKYLRKNKIVHRDWKPSNILKTVTNDGDIFYKLCDFGAARELDDNEPFLSIVGTEEYIQPEIYGRGLLGKSTDSFSATSELWSFGVTLYHVTTGHLPFKPFGGRKNRDTMYKIISSKQSGIISGVQETENGPIVWSNVLPRYCRLSGLEDSSTLESAEKNCCQTKNALESEKINNQRMIVEWRGMNREDIVISHNNNILTVLDRSVCSTFEILMQFRNDKVLLVRHPSESQNNELKWHGLLKRQLRNTWNHVKEQFKNDIVLTDMLQLHKFLSSAQKFHSKLVLSKESLDLAEKMVITFDNSVKQLLLKHGCAQKPREVNGHSPVSTSEQDARNSSVSSSVSDSLLETIDDLKDMRKIALKNRSLLNEILSMSSDQTDVDSVEAS